MNNLSENQYDSAPDGRTSQIRQLVLMVSQRRLAGEAIADQDIIAQNDNLMPDLAQELVKLHRIEAARRATTQAQGASSSGSSQPADSSRSGDSGASTDGGSGGEESSEIDGLSRVILTHSQLDAVIEMSPDGAGEESASGEPEPAAAFALPAIEGYEVIGEIGRGGQAVVVEGRQHSTGQRVAIKVLRGGPLVTSRERILFDREVQILASLRQRNVVGIIDRGTTKEGWSYLVMQFVEGQTLDHYACQCRARTTDLLAARRGLLEVFLKVLSAMQAAHDAGIVHRDLKPSNILVDAQGEPHILDFGLAHLARDLPGAGSTQTREVTHTGHFVGSLPYASPEQASGNLVDLDRRSDVYSLGVILYQMLTGKFPYAVSGQMWTVVNNIRNEVPLPPSRVPVATSEISGISQTPAVHWAKGGFQAKSAERSLDAIVLKALAKAPPERYPSAAVLADDLRSWLAGGPIASGKRRLASWLSWSAVGLLVLAAGMAGAARWGPWHRSTAPPSRSAPVAVPAAALLSSPEARVSGRAFSSPPYPLANLPKFTNSVEMTLVGIPPGEFLMGSPESEAGRRDDETQHSVPMVKSFYLAVTKVTQRQYRLVTGTNPSDPRWIGDDIPVNHVSWDDAVRFCATLSAKEGLTYRLPTEKEWEYACRASTQGRFAGTGRLPDMGWFNENRLDYMAAVARRFPNHWGLYDMHGLVWEWCANVYSSYSSPTEDSAALPGPKAMLVIRGGSFSDPWKECRAATRDAKLRETALPTLGFRVATDAMVKSAAIDPANH